jgi:C4-dicarboxylate transporter DctM subunit
LYAAFAETAVLVGSLVLIVVLAFGLNDFLAEIEAAERMGEWLRTAHLTPVTFLLVVNVALVFIGALMDSVSATLVFAPLLAPIALQVYGIDPIHFGVVFVVNMEIGYLMPPVATNLFVGAAIFKRPFGEVARAVMPTLGIVCAALVVIMYVPTLSKGLVNWKQDLPMVEAFPWDGPGHVDPVDEPSADAGPAPGDAGPAEGKPLTMEEMMRRAREAQADAGTPAPSGTDAPKRPLTMEEMMKQAREAQGADAGP